MASRPSRRSDLARSSKRGAQPARDAAQGPGLFDEPAGGPTGEAASEAEAPPTPPTARRVTVGELTRDIGARLEALGRVSVEGELSGIKRYASGHLYFDLKEEGARLSCAIWRSRIAQAMRFEPEDGMQVVAHGKLDVYAPRGSYSLIVERLEPLGIGALLAQLEELKRELSALGWFDRRRPLPERPRSIGVVTSRDGAALRDFLRTRSLRWPSYPVRLCHTPVQGPGAALEIAEAIERLDRSGVDVIVVCRGGGSLEDLWAFNERPVAEAIHRCSVPVVSGVGHETDTTLADLVADHRAHTPTDAAASVIPDRAQLLAQLARLGNYLIDAADRTIERRAERLHALAQRGVLRRGDWILGHRLEALGHARARLAAAAQARAVHEDGRLRAAHHRLERHSPATRLEGWGARMLRAGERLRALGQRELTAGEHRLGLAAAALERISPLAVLKRGYSLTTRADEGDGLRPLVDAEGLAPGARLRTRLARGSVLSDVVGVEPPEPDESGSSPA